MGPDPATRYAQGTQGGQQLVSIDSYLKRMTPGVVGAIGTEAKRRVSMPIPFRRVSVVKTRMAWKVRWESCRTRLVLVIGATCTLVDARMYVSKRLETGDKMEKNST